MKIPLRTLATLGLLSGVACAENPILQPDVHDEELEVVVTFATEHLATLTSVEVEVDIADHDGTPVADFERVTLQTRPEGEEEWVSTDLEAHGGHFSGKHMFFSSGEHELRVVAVHHGETHEETLHERAEHLEVERIHREAGHFTVEMETFPGRIHEGEEAEVRFWVLEQDDVRGGMMGMPGLQATLDFHHHASGVETSHVAEEHDPGVYEAHHLFAEHGETEVVLEFDDDHGDRHSVAFHVPVAEAH